MTGKQKSLRVLKWEPAVSARDSWGAAPSAENDVAGTGEPVFVILFLFCFKIGLLKVGKGRFRVKSIYIYIYMVKF